jgi:hypothetical protein
MSILLEKKQGMTQKIYFKGNFYGILFRSWLGISNCYIENEICQQIFFI